MYSLKLSVGTWKNYTLLRTTYCFSFKKNVISVFHGNYTCLSYVTTLTSTFGQVLGHVSPRTRPACLVSHSLVQNRPRKSCIVSCSRLSSLNEAHVRLVSHVVSGQVVSCQMPLYTFEILGLLVKKSVVTCGLARYARVGLGSCQNTILIFMHHELGCVTQWPLIKQIDRPLNRYFLRFLVYWLKISVAVCELTSHTRVGLNSCQDSKIIFILQAWPLTHFFHFPFC